MMIEGKAARCRWTGYFEEQSNVKGGEQASVVAIGSDRRMPEIGRLNDGGVESYEVVEEMSKIKDGKAPGLNQYAVEFFRKGGRNMVGCLVRLLNCCF